MDFSIIKNTFVRQHDQTDCGVACLVSIVKFHGGNVSFDRVGHLSGKDQQGTSLLGLYQAANSLDFQADGYEAEGMTQLDDVSTPCILHLTVKESLQHFVVYYGRHDSKYIIGDPEAGVVKWDSHELDAKWKTKSLLVLNPTENFVKDQSKKPNKLNWLRTMLKEDLNLLSASLFLGIIISTLTVATAVFSQKLIDQIIPSGNTKLLILSVFIFALVLGIRVFLAFVRGKFLVSQSQSLNNRMTTNFFSGLLNLPKHFFDAKKTGDFISRLNDIRRIQALISNLVGNILIQLLTTVIVTVAIFSYSLHIGLLILGVLPLYILLLFKLNNKVSSAQREVMKAHSNNESNYIDAINGIQEIKLNQKEPLFEAVTVNKYKNFQHKIFIFGNLKLRFNIAIEMLGMATTLLVMSYAAYLVMNKAIQVGELVAIFSLSSTIIPSVGFLILSNIQIQEAIVAYDRMVEFTETSDHYSDKIEKTKKSISTIENICIENISFKYPGTLRLLEGISLSIKKGSLRVLLGESGSGKSTLVQLVLRFYKIDSGTITLDGVPFEKCNTNDFRKLVGVVPQETKIFNNTLLFNIALSTDKSDLLSAKKWCTDNGFDKYFESINHGYAAYIGEDGVRLSGGQKQLVSLARALYRKPQFLIVDEGTSSLDRITEAFYLEKLNEIKARTGILFITHRIKTASRGDYIYTIEDGRISTSGTPEELLTYTNFYSQSYHDLVRV